MKDRLSTTGLPETGSEALRSHRRLRGIDAARAIAVIGMVMVHFGPAPADAVGNLYGISHGRASVLFALLAGIGVSLLAGGSSQGRPRGWSLLIRGRLVLRGALLLPLGLWLQTLDHGALVILQYYAVYFLFAALVLTLPDRWLLTGGATVLVVGPLIYLWGQMQLGWEWFARWEPAQFGDSASKIADDLLLTGGYPLVTWAAPLLIGMWIGRRDLEKASVRWWLLFLGLVFAIGTPLTSDRLSTKFDVEFLYPGGYSFGELLTDEPHQQMPLWMLGAIGSACAVLGGMLLLADWLPRTMWPLVATGQLALTVYVGHLLLLDAWPALQESESVQGASLNVGIFMLLVIAACTLWRVVLPRGPLEALLAAPWWIFGRILRQFTSGQHGSKAGTGR